MYLILEVGSFKSEDHDPDSYRDRRQNAEYRNHHPQHSIQKERIQIKSSPTYKLHTY